MWTIYLLRSSDGFGYVGRTQSYEQRLIYHRKSKNKSRFISEAIKDLGWSDFTAEILESDINDLITAKSREEFWILELKTLYPDGYNIKLGDKITKEHQKILYEAKIYKQQELNRRLRAARPIRPRPRTEI